ncbi:MAG TPA: hypothetical protein VGX68_22285 [Thermoanaerobaculia bacterium]|jgi:hypothetical protein|nr:hypothetical protein [Thermoanaerobaculia bacterium]
MSTQSSKPSKYFAETAVGAVVLVSLQFLSLSLLVGGLLLIGIAKLVSAPRASRAGSGTQSS